MVLYLDQYPVTWTAQSALHFIPWRTCSFRHQLDLAMLQLREWTGVSWREQKCPNFEAVAKWIQTRVLSNASGILPLSYRTPQRWCVIRHKIETTCPILCSNFSFIHLNMTSIPAAEMRFIRRMMFENKTAGQTWMTPIQYFASSLFTVVMTSCHQFW